MNYFINYFLLLLIVVPLVSLGQNNNEELLKWSDSKKLTWADYKAKPDPDSDAAASTTTNLVIDYKITNRSFSFKIESRFSKSRSWGLHKTEYILSHEQGHFDIAEIFARILNKRMSAYQFNSKTYQKDLQKIYEEVTQEKENTQNKYDKETNHSIRKEEQAIWLKKIQLMLEEYADWANY